jgi:hypothetical protein
MLTTMQEADDEYFHRPRHIFKNGIPLQLSCGATFDGRRPSLDLPHLRTYSRTVHTVLERFTKQALPQS